MVSIIITDFELSIPTKQDYNWNTEFEQSFAKNTNLKRLSFDLPEDMFYLSYMLCSLRAKGLTHFQEFNGTIEDKTKFKAIVLIEPEVKQFEFTYMTKNDQISNLLEKRARLELSIKNIQDEILSLS
jgi:hypothetical protein